MQSDDVITDLMRLGLHKNEAKAYKALVSLGSASARTVAEQSGVPRSKVYDVLYALENKAMVRRTAGTDPVEFTPIDPEVAIGYLEEKMEKSADSARTLLSELADSREEDNLELVWTVVGEEQIRVGARSLIENADSAVFIATRNFNFLRSLKPSMAKAKQKGVEIQLVSLGTNTEELDEFKHYLSMLELKEVSSEDITTTLQRVLRDPSLRDAGWDPNQLSIIVADNKESLGIFRDTREYGKPWALHIRSPLIVIFQRQVIISLMAAIERMFGKFIQS
ncbi:MAG: helix-turn-helix domain-containing protein [Candidatus Thorarchaeota archaeon]